MAAIDESQKGAPNGVASLDGVAEVTSSQRGVSPAHLEHRDIFFAQKDDTTQAANTVWSTNTPLLSGVANTDTTNVTANTTKLQNLLNVITNSNYRRRVIGLTRGLFINSPLAIGQSSRITGSFSSYGYAGLRATGDHALLKVNGDGQLLSMIDNIAIDMQLMGTSANYAIDLKDAGQWRLSNIFGSSHNVLAKFARLTHCNNLLLDNFRVMENSGQYLEILGRSTSNLFLSGSFEATSGQVGLGGYLDCYIDHTNTALTTGLAKYANSGFYGVQLERFGTLTVRSGGWTFQDGNISEASRIVLTNRASECRIENSGGRIINLGSRNIVSRAHALNWTSERPIVVGENALTPIGTYPGDPARSAYYPSDGSTEYLFWNRLSGQATGGRVKYWNGTHAGTYIDESPSGVNLIPTDFSAGNVGAQDDVTHITCLKGTQSRISAGVFADSGDVHLHARAYRNLLADGTFDTGLSAKWAKSSVTAAVVAGAFGSRAGVELTASGGAWEIAQVARLRPGRHYMAIACVKLGSIAGFRLSAGSANDGSSFAQYVTCDAIPTAQLTQAGRSAGVDGGAGDGRQYLQIVWQMPVADASGLGAFAKISLGGFGAAANSTAQVSWIALVDLDEPKKTLSFGPPPSDHGTWNVGDEVQELNPLASGYTSWKSCVVFDTGLVPAWGWVGVGEVYKPTSYAASVQVDADLGARFKITLAGNLTVAAPLHPVVGRRLVFFVQQDGSGGRTVSWDAVFSNLGSTPNGSAATAGQRAIYIFNCTAVTPTPNWQLESVITWF